MGTERLGVWVLLPALAAAGATVPLHAATAAEGTAKPVLTVLERTAEPLLKADRPWESMGIGLDQVLRTGDQQYGQQHPPFGLQQQGHLCRSRCRRGGEAGHLLDLLWRHRGTP